MKHRKEYKKKDKSKEKYECYFDDVFTEIDFNSFKRLRHIFHTSCRLPNIYTKEIMTFRQKRYIKKFTVKTLRQWKKKLMYSILNKEGYINEEYENI